LATNIAFFGLPFLGSSCENMSLNFLTKLLPNQNIKIKTKGHKRESEKNRERNKPNIVLDIKMWFSSE
jgi:hypothetical protein